MKSKININGDEEIILSREETINLIETLQVNVQKSTNHKEVSRIIISKNKIKVRCVE